MAQAPRNMQVASPFAFNGGLDQTSASLAVPGGRVIAGLNYEPIVNGYRRVQGHERTDGRLPSSMKSSRIDIGSIVGGGGYSNGTVITGATSGATAVVLQQLGVGATVTLAITNIVGTFIVGETTTGIHRCTLLSLPYVVANDPYDEAAANYLRGLIGPPPGSGPVRGGFVFNGVAYAIRDNAGASAAVVYKATTAGWVAQSFGRWITFGLGVVEIAEGATITGGTSGATAHVERVIVRDGAWGAALAADQAAGTLVLSGQTGAFVSGETFKVGGTVCATNYLGSNSILVGLSPGGRYDCKIVNFYGAANRKRVYLVNGINPAAEYDGASIMVPIFTGTPVDQPTRIFTIANALGLCFPGGSIQISEPGEPCVFNAILGALEIGIGDDITDVVSSFSSSVVFFCKGKIAKLTGRDSETFVLEDVTDEAGSIGWTAQRIGETLYLDHRGLRNLTNTATISGMMTTASFGDFQAGAVSELFDRYLDAKRRAGANPVASLRVKSKTQYRLFYDDGTGFTVFLGGKNPSMLPFETDALQVYTTFSGEMTDGSEGLFGCGNDGYLYRLDSGTSFDGVTVRAFVMLPFNHCGNVNMNKRFHSVSIELDAASQTRLGVVAQFDYGDGEQPISGNQDFSTFDNANDFTIKGGGEDFILTAGGGAWDPTTWGTFYWSNAYQGMAEAEVDGAGRNISLIIASPATAMEAPHTLQSYTIHWSPRGAVKRTAL